MFGLSGTKHFKQMVEPAEPQRKASGITVSSIYSLGSDRPSSLRHFIVHIIKLMSKYIDCSSTAALFVFDAALGYVKFAVLSEHCMICTLGYASEH